MIRLQVTPEQALQELQTIGHLHCQQAISTCWIVDPDRNVRPQSILWLFCWATTGQSSQRAAREAREVFDRIFDRPYEWLSRRITLEYARERRYADFDIEEELQVSSEPDETCTKVSLVSH